MNGLHKIITKNNYKILNLLTSLFRKNFHENLIVNEIKRILTFYKLPLSIILSVDYLLYEV